METEEITEIQDVMQQIPETTAVKDITTDAAARQIAEKRLSADSAEK